MDTLLVGAKKVSMEGKARFQFANEEGYVEEIALLNLNQSGWEGFWSENTFWWHMLAVLFWDEIFAKLDGVYHPSLGDFPSELQDMPKDLFQKTFYPRRKELFESRIQKLKNDNLIEAFLDSYEQNYGKSCRLVEDWDSFSQKQFTNVIHEFSPDLLINILKTLLIDFNSHRRGLPDLVIWNQDDYGFAEVKGPGDSLQKTQKRWLTWLDEWGAFVFLIKIRDSDSIGEIQKKVDTRQEEIGEEIEMPTEDDESKTASNQSSFAEQPQSFSGIDNLNIEPYDTQDEEQAQEAANQITKLAKSWINQGRDRQDTASEIKLWLLPFRIEWPDFKEWYDYFNSIEFFPRMWEGLEYPATFSEKATSYWVKFANLSIESKKLLKNLRYISTKRKTPTSLIDAKRDSDLPPKTAARALDELETSGFISRDVRIKDRLHFLRVKDLKPILEEHDLKKSGRKAELTRRLAENVSEEELTQYLPAEARDDLIALKRTLPEEDKEAFDYHEKLIDLIVHTLSTVASTQSTVDRASEHDISSAEIHITGNCPICNSMSESVNLKPGAEKLLPPFHPGCRCASTPKYKGISKAIEVSSKKSKSGCLVFLLIVSIGIISVVFI